MTTSFKRAPAWLRRLVSILGALLFLWCILLIPDAEDRAPGRSQDRPKPAAFVWDQDSIWYGLEQRYVDARGAGCASVRPRLEGALARVGALITHVAAGDRSPEDTLFPEIERQLFEAAPDVAGCPDVFPAFLREATRLRDAIKKRSAVWVINEGSTRRTMYRLMYGGRAALEEVMLQLPPEHVPALVLGHSEPSEAPSAEILGVRIHSGDILVSRGGAPTSALIARGNDFPGNFSHVALVHIDSATKAVGIIESHIEKGVAVASIEEYLRDTKLRVMVMRLRHDHPAVRSNPLIGHRAAQAALNDAGRRHIPYDFEMRYDDPSKLFCSEVASAAYASVGVRLWKGLSTISTPGLRRWLGAFGVRYFETQEPSDLEYDPQLSVVAEWRDPETLYQDHLDNAVTEAMLEGAERGDEIGYDWHLLPMARVMKLYSLVLNQFGAVGPVPEGMSATAALRNRWYSGRHATARTAVQTKADAFQASNGYRPPYWRLVAMARASLAELPT